MTLAVDPHALDGAGTAIISTGADVGVTLSTLTGALSGSTSMCGNDPVGAAMGRSYDATAQSLLTAMTAARNGLTNIGDGVRVSAYNYSRANASSDVSGRSQPLPVPASTGRINAAALPSSVGAAAGAPAGWGWVSKYIGMIWPNGDPGKLRAAASAWTAAGTSLLNTELAVQGPMGVVAAQQIPEAEAMGGAFGDSVRAAGKVLASCATLAGGLHSYAAHIETTHAAIIDLLARICDPMTGMKEVWDFLTQEDEDEIAKIAADIKTVVGNFESETSALAAQMAPMMAEAATTVSEMGRWADREWQHFLNDNAAGQELNGMGQSVKGFGEEAVELVKDAWKYSPQRAVLDPEGAETDWKTMVTGMAPLVGLGGDGSRGVLESWKEVGKDTVHWDDWKKNPAEALGKSLLDVATFFVPGGALTKLGKAGTGAAHVAEDAASSAPRILETGARAADLPKPAGPHVEAPEPVPIATAAKPGEAVPAPRPGDTPPAPAPRSANTPGEPATRPAEPQPLSPPSTGSHYGPTEQRPAPAAATTGSAAGESAPHATPVSAAATAPDDLLGKPGLASAAPSADAASHNLAPRSSHAPTALPETVPAAESVAHVSPGEIHGGGSSGGAGGGVRGGGDPHAGGSNGSGAGGDGHSTGGGGGNHGDGPAGDSHHGSSDGDHPAPHDPVHSQEPHGDGWERMDDKPDDPSYGQPLPDHWTGDAYPYLDHIDPEVRELVSDTGAPYGRDADGTPFTKDQYEERYNKYGPNGEHYNNYPPNDGASMTTKVRYTSIEDFIRDYGSSLDRLGEPNGRYLAIMPNGKSAAFEARALPVESLNLKHYTYELSGCMPEGFSIGISEVAPAFGREGGSLQVLMYNEKGVEMSVNDLYEAGMLQ